MAQLHRAPVPSADRVLVIGAGPAGLAAAAALQALGVEFDLVDRSGHVGGIWNLDADDTPVRPGMTMVSSRGRTEFEDLLMPVSFPAFPRAEEMSKYLKAYAAKHDLDDAFSPNEGVMSATPFAEGRWEVEFDNGQVRPYRAIIAATGSAWHPHLPAWAGPLRSSSARRTAHPEPDEFPLAAFDETAERESERPGSRGGVPVVLHAREVGDPEAFRGRRVLIVGGGTSAAESAMLSANSGAAETRLSMRTGHWVVQREVVGLPGDRLAAARPRRLGALNNRIAEAMVSAVVGKPQEFGLPRPAAPLMLDTPIVSEDLIEALSQRRIVPAPHVREVDDTGTVTFAGGPTWRPDVIVCATGYEPAYPFLPEGLVPDADGAPDLFLGAFHRERDDLVLLGQFRTTDVAQIRLTVEQADIAAYFLKARFGDAAGSGADPRQAETFRKVRVEDPVAPLRHRDAPESAHYDCFEASQFEHALRVVRSIFEQRA